MAEKKKMGRPKVQVDLSEVQELAAEGVSCKAIASAMGFSESTLFARKDVRAAYDNGRGELEINLRHWQMQSAKSGNSQLLIHLEKLLEESGGFFGSTQIEKYLTQKVTDPMLLEIARRSGIKVNGTMQYRDFIVCAVVAKALSMGAGNSFLQFSVAVQKIIGLEEQNEESDIIKSLRAGVVEEE